MTCWRSPRTWRRWRRKTGYLHSRSIHSRTNPMHQLSKVALALLFVAGPASVMAQGTVNRPQISAALANQLVGDTVAICAKQNYRVWAVVVNLDGVRQALLRGDGAPIHSQDNAYYKA